MSKEYLSVAETAKLVRAALKRAFPGVKFGVRSKSYSGGASIDVNWTDGPTAAEVKAVTSAYEGAGFDGMIDLKYHYESWLLPDGTAVVHRSYGHSFDNATVTPEKPHPDARLVSFGADYIFEHRSISPALATRAVAELVARYGLPFDAATAVSASPYDGMAVLSREASSYRRDDWSSWFSDLYYRALRGLRGDGTRTHDVHGFELREEDVA